MSIPDSEQEKARLEQELIVQRQIAFTSGIFQGDVTIRTLLESLVEGVVIIDKSGTILLTNTRAEQMFGYPSKELIGKPHAILIPQRFRKVHEEHEAHFFEEPKTRPMGMLPDFAGLRRDGSEFPVEVSLNFIESINGILVLAFINDITLRKQYETSLQQSEELSRILGVIDYAIFILDAEGNVRSWNAGAERLNGYRNEEIIGKHFSCFYPEADRAGGKPADKLKIAAADKRAEYEGWILRKDGSLFWAAVIITAIRDENGSLRGFSNVTRDITERKQAADALRLEKHFTDTVINSMPGIFYVFDDQEQLVRWNKRLEEFSGRSPEEMPTLRPHDFVSEEKHGQLEANLREVFVEHRNADAELLIPDREGKKVPFYCTGSPMTVGDKTYLVGLGIDITERKQAEDALRDSEENLRYIVKHDPNAIAVLDRTLHYIAVSNRFLQDYNVKEEEILGKHHYEVFPEMPQEWKDVHQRCLAGAVERNDDDHFERPDGSITYNRWECRPWRRVDGEIGGIVIYTEVTTERKEAEKALRESEALFRRMFDQAPIGAAMVSLEYRFLMVNEALCRLTGYSVEELTSRSFVDITHPDDIDADVAQARQLVAGEIDQYDRDKRYLRPDGSVVWVHINARLIRDVEGVALYFLPMIEDITQRKRAEEALRETEQKLRSIVEHSTNLFYVHNTDHVLTYVSPQTRQFFDCEPEEAMVRWMELITDNPANRAAIEATQRAIDTGERQPPYQVECLGKKSREIWVEVHETPLVENGKTVAIIGSLTDITDHKRAEDALRESEDKFSRAFQAVPSLLAIATLDEGRYIEVNEAFERITGHRRSDTIGRTSLETRLWKNPDDHGRIIGMLREGRKVRDLELSFVTKSGTVFIGLYSAEIIEINGEKCLLSLANDITGRKWAEEEIERLNTDLAARAAELEAVNRELEAFNYTVAHDLRKPLTVVNGYCQALRETCCDKLDEECKDYIQEAYEGTWRMNRLIDALLNFSRMGQVQLCREMVDLSGAAQAVAEELVKSDPARQVEFRITEGISVLGDANLLRVVLDNVIGNAWKYTGIREDAVIEFGRTEIEGKPACFVRDNGAGFDMAVAGKLFAPFQRVSGASIEGHGIGLATVERIISRHGGRVWAEGELGKGATFYFTLP